MLNSNSKYLITAAGGNGTAISVLKNPLVREEYVSLGKQLGNDYDSCGAEQAGFLILSTDHFEMAGGEFCGNASRSAAVLFSELKGEKEITFTVSGFAGKVQALVNKLKENVYDVSCTFPGLSTNLSIVTLQSGQVAQIVDLGGIVHVVIEAEFPKDKSDYEAQHKIVLDELHLEQRDAVGVIWIEKTKDNSVKMHPVVWVRSINTFFYETSCGSGTIATARVTGISSVIQPSGQSIIAEINNNNVVLKSIMEVTHVFEC